MLCCLVRVLVLFVVFFFKQKTAYEMRISDWSSDVCSSDLAQCGQPRGAIGVGQRDAGLHFGVVAGAMKIVALDELPAQCFRQGLRDGRFTAARNTHDDDCLLVGVGLIAALSSLR